MKDLSVSIVVPVYNEERNVGILHERLQAVCRHFHSPYEVIFVDDGSTDRTVSMLEEAHKKDPHTKIIALRRNFGQTAALQAGIDHALHEVIVTLDGDLQNDPEDILLLLEKIKEGYDIVSGWRRHRKDSLSRTIPSKIANMLISHVTGVRLKDYGCTLKAYRTEIIKSLHLFGDMHRFIPALASWQGVRIAEIPVKHHPRIHGKAKYGLGRTIRVLLDLLTVKFMVGYRAQPLQMFGPFGFLLMLSGFGYGTFLVCQRLMFEAYIKPLRPLIAVLLVVTGLQLITMGLLGEMIMRTYFESQNKPIYAVRKIVG